MNNTQKALVSTTMTFLLVPFLGASERTLEAPRSHFLGESRRSNNRSPREPHYLTPTKNDENTTYPQLPATRSLSPRPPARAITDPEASYPPSVPQLSLAGSPPDVLHARSPRSPVGEEQRTRRRAGTFSAVSDRQVINEATDYKQLFDSMQRAYLAHGAKPHLDEQILKNLIRLTQEQENADYYPIVCKYVGEIYLQGLVNGVKSEQAGYPHFMMASALDNPNVKANADVWIAACVARGFESFNAQEPQIVIDLHVQPLIDKKLALLDDREKYMLHYLYATLGSILKQPIAVSKSVSSLQLCIDQNHDLWIQAAAKLHMGDLLTKTSLHSKAVSLWAEVKQQNENPVAKALAEQRLKSGFVPPFVNYAASFVVPWYDPTQVVLSPKKVESPKTDTAQSPKQNLAGSLNTQPPKQNLAGSLKSPKQSSASESKNCLNPSSIFFD